MNREDHLSDLAFDSDTVLQANLEILVYDAYKRTVMFVGPSWRFWDNSREDKELKDGFPTKKTLKAAQTTDFSP